MVRFAFLHWPTVDARIQYKLASLYYNYLSPTAPKRDPNTSLLHVWIFLVMKKSETLLTTYDRKQDPRTVCLFVFYLR